MKVEVQKKMVRKVTKIEVPEYHLVLCHDEAIILTELLGSITGDPETTYRGVTSSMRQQLLNSSKGMCGINTHFNGNLVARTRMKTRK